MSFRDFRRAGLSLAIIAGLGVATIASPASAGDDGSAPIWVGFGSTLGLIKGPNDVSIDYRERGKLVLPPKLTLPPPGSTAVQTNAAWPVDPDLVKERKAKKEAADEKLERVGRARVPIVRPGVNTIMVTSSATAGQGPGAAPCITKDPKTGQCPVKYGTSTLNLNPLTWVGLEKKPSVVLGPEPDRDFLTDPPKGLRAPVEGVGAVADQ